MSGANKSKGITVGYMKSDMISPLAQKGIVAKEAEAPTLPQSVSFNEQLERNRNGSGGGGQPFELLLGNQSVQVWPAVDANGLRHLVDSDGKLVNAMDSLAELYEKDSEYV